MFCLLQMLLWICTEYSASIHQLVHCDVHVGDLCVCGTTVTIIDIGSFEAALDRSGESLGLGTPDNKP